MAPCDIYDNLTSTASHTYSTNIYEQCLDSINSSSIRDYMDSANSLTVNNYRHNRARLEEQAFASGTYHLCNTTSSEFVVPLRVLAPGDRMREILASRHAPAFLRRGRRRMLGVTTDVPEIRARETLLRILGKKDYRRFLRDGFITVRAKSGLVYRIFPGSGMTDVYKDGKPVDKLCVVLKGQFPPTDSLIMRYLLVLNDEGEFCKLAVQWTPDRDRNLAWTPPVPEQLTLPEQWAQLKLVA